MPFFSAYPRVHHRVTLITKQDPKQPTAKIFNGWAPRGNCLRDVLLAQFKFRLVINFSEHDPEKFEKISSV